MHAPQSQLRYVSETPPRGAETIEVAPDVLWARLPLPFRLNHVNVWPNSLPMAEEHVAGAPRLSNAGFRWSPVNHAMHHAGMNAIRPVP